MKFIKKIFISINILIILATVLAYLNVYIPPTKLSIFPVFGLFYPILFFLNCFFVIFWLFQDVKWMIPSVLTLILGWNHIAGFIGFNNKSAESTIQDLSVLSYNTHFFWEARQEYKTQATRKVATFFAEMEDLDILCLQEFNTTFETELLSRLKGFDLIKYENRRAVIISKYPAIDYGEVDFGTRTNSCVWADIVIEKDTIRVYSTHLQSSKISQEAGHVLDNIDLQQRDTWKGAFTVLAKYRGSAIRRMEQATLIKKHMQKCPYRIIIAGDFNEPPTSYTYRILSENMVDSFCEKGKGMTSTYGGRIPFLRIDYIIGSKEMNVLSYETLDNIDFSDHYPIKATFKI